MNVIVNYVETGGNIKKYRLLRDISISQLSTIIGITNKKLELIEGGHKFNIDVLINVCNALNITPDELLEYEII